MEKNCIYIPSLNFEYAEIYSGACSVGVSKTLGFFQPLFFPSFSVLILHLGAMSGLAIFWQGVLYGSLFTEAASLWLLLLENFPSQVFEKGGIERIWTRELFLKVLGNLEASLGNEKSVRSGVERSIIGCGHDLGV